MEAILNAVNCVVHFMNYKVCVISIQINRIFVTSEENKCI